MKIKMLTGLCGPDYNLAPGDAHDFGDAEAVRLIEAGFAVPLAEIKSETATKKPAAERRAKG
jgi:hypothetical protein